MDESTPLRQVAGQIETMKACNSTKAEQFFRVVERQLGHHKVPNHGLATNIGQSDSLFALSKLWMVRVEMLALDGQVRRKAANAA